MSAVLALLLLTVHGRGSNPSGAEGDPFVNRWSPRPPAP